MARILAGIDYREMLAREADCDLDLSGLEEHFKYLKSTEHAIAVAVVAREELGDAVAQLARHGGSAERLHPGCGYTAPCLDAMQANRTLARFAMLYDVSSVPSSTCQTAGH